ncbi:hypothetical protein D3C71_1140470 [compost metagenome]
MSRWEGWQIAQQAAQVVGHQLVHQFLITVIANAMQQIAVALGQHCGRQFARAL